MTSLITILVLLLLLCLVRYGFFTWAWGQYKVYLRRRDWLKLKEELSNEILEGHNLARIAALKLRMRELEDAGLGWW